MRKALLLLPVLIAVSLHGQTVTATANPVSISFSYQAGAALPSAQTIAVRASAGTPSYTIAITGTNTLWLTVSPGSGKLPASLSARANPTSLGVGTYSANIVLTVTGVATPLSIPATLVVSSPPSTLALSAITLGFTAPPLPPAAQAVQLSTSGAPISFTATSGAPWLQLSPSVGVVLPGEQFTLSITADPTGLNPQAAPYVGKITVVASGVPTANRSQTITVNFTVNSSTPTIASIWPAALPINAGAQTITIRGTNFYTLTVAKIQGVTAPLATTVLSPTALLAVVPASALAAAATLSVIASNPAPGGNSTASTIAVANVPAIQAVANVASYATTSLSPGELATIFGSNVGPTAPTSMTVANGFVTTSLGGVSVTVDGQAAPLLYASQNQITIQVPYECTLGAGKQVVVTNNANPPATATVTIAATAPGIFTTDSSGVGQAAALNFNATTSQYTLNATANQAKIGDTIILYATGEGDYATGLPPPSHTGLVIPSTLSPLPQVNPLPTVTIGGVPATVNYAGPIVGSIIGLLQLNVVIPAGSTTGSAVPVSIGIGGNVSQSNVTIAVHP